MSSAAALNAVKIFRFQQFYKLESHIRRLGPLSKDTIPKHKPDTVVVLPNPFIPRKNPVSGKWRPPAYSLRRQAELVKKAKASGLLHLLPPGPKSPQARLGVTPSPVEAHMPTEGHSDGQKNEEDKVWQQPIVWEGKFKQKKVRLGIRLYAGKKRMFKGHKWERMREGRMKKRDILLRDMKKRILSYKNYYKRRKPSPLKPPRTLKSPKLPF